MNNKHNNVNMSNIISLIFDITTTVNKLSKIYFLDKTIPNKDTTCCSICLHDIVQDEQIYDFKCGHVFHTHCILQTLMTSNKCPLCRVAIIPNDTTKDRKRYDLLIMNLIEQLCHII